jgi:GH24 family phage-related lysozyme (muramidase)
MGFHSEQDINDSLLSVRVDPTIASQVGKEAAGLKASEAKAYADKHGAKGTRLIHLSKKQQIDLQSAYLPTYEKIVQKNVHIPLLQREFDALVSFTSNPGSPGLRTVSTPLNQGRVSDALLEILYRIPPKGSKIRSGLMARRRREVEWFITGRYTI